MKPVTLHKRACALLGISPDKVPLVGPTRWREITGRGVGRNLGVAHHKHRIIYVRREREDHILMR